MKACNHDRRAPIVFELSHRSKPGLESPVVGFDAVVGVLRGVMVSGRDQVHDRPGQRWGAVGGHLGRFAM